MIDDRAVRLAAALADASQRAVAERELSAHVGAVAILLFVDDPAVEALIPAPGFRPTLPGGAGWADLLRRARAPGVHHSLVGYPSPTPLVPALAITAAGITIVFLGGECDHAAVQGVQAVAPLLAATLRAEHHALAAQGELQVARDQARHAENLTRALDSARAEVEQSFLALERQTSELQEARAHAEEATKAKDEFLAMLGHELRNPLSPIVTALQLMRLKNQTSHEQEVIERQVGSLIRLVDDLLDVSRITRGKIDLRRELVELAEIAARAIEMASPAIEKKRQILAVTIPPRGLVVDGDPSRLAQVFANLLTNAAKYSDTETTIEFAAERRDSKVRVRVKDHGIGLATDMQDRVFDLFVQHRQSIDRAQGGLGLGLAIVRNLVFLHGGTVTAHSEGEGRGSEFVVNLPHAAQAVIAAPDPVQPQRRALSAPQRILVVDDNVDASALLSEMLVSLGYQVRAAPDGPAALRVAQEFQPHVALLDIGLPVMDGYELARRMLANPAGHRPRLVAVTGYGQAQDRVRSREAGFDAHLVKPVAIDALQRVFEEFREGRTLAS